MGENRSVADENANKPAAAGTLEIDAEARDGAAWLTLRGELDLATAPVFERALIEAEGGSTPLVLDLRQLGFIDSSGLRVILSAASQATEAGRRLVIVRGQNQVARVLDITGSDQHLEVVDEPPSL